MPIATPLPERESKSRWIAHGILFSSATPISIVHNSRLSIIWSNYFNSAVGIEKASDDELDRITGIPWWKRVVRHPAHNMGGLLRHTNSTKGN